MFLKNTSDGKKENEGGTKTTDKTNPWSEREVKGRQENKAKSERKGRRGEIIIATMRIYQFNERRTKNRAEDTATNAWTNV